MAQHNSSSFLNQKNSVGWVIPGTRQLSCPCSFKIWVPSFCGSHTATLQAWTLPAPTPTHGWTTWTAPLCTPATEEELTREVSFPVRSHSSWSSLLFLPSGGLTFIWNQNTEPKTELDLWLNRRGDDGNGRKPSEVTQDKQLTSRCVPNHLGWNRSFSELCPKHLKHSPPATVGLRDWMC